MFELRFSDVTLRRSGHDGKQLLAGVIDEADKAFAGETLKVEAEVAQAGEKIAIRIDGGTIQDAAMLVDLVNPGRALEVERLGKADDIVERMSLFAGSGPVN